MKRACLKCKNNIPFSKTINGKRKSLKNRKFCLNCSPYKEKKQRKVFCRNCGEKIPSIIKINGEIKNLGSRKFCILCSPVNSHNTKKYINQKSRVGCYSDWDEEIKIKHRKFGKKCRDNRKQKLVELSGGSCLRCGYSKCLRALSFHHRNPKEKEFELNKSNLRKPWKMILKEHKKCDLLCVRCHLEIEDELLREQ